MVFIQDNRDSISKVMGVIFSRKGEVEEGRWDRSALLSAERYLGQGRTGSALRVLLSLEGNMGRVSEFHDNNRAQRGRHYRDNQASEHTRDWLRTTAMMTGH